MLRYKEIYCDRLRFLYTSIYNGLDNRILIFANLSKVLLSKLEINHRYQYLTDKRVEPLP